METHAELREKYRPHGILAAKCPDCFLFEHCGGIEPEHPMFDDCFDLFCCQEKECDNVCPYNDRFRQRLIEVGGLECDSLPDITQPQVNLPPYIPMIHHGSSRVESLDCPIVALDTYLVFRLNGDTYEPVESDAAALRRRFGLAVSTRIVLRGTAKDPLIERYWTYRRRDSVPEQMSQLGIEMVISPNYSHFLDVPRPDNVFNRKRQLLCLGEFSQAGVVPVPHLSANTTGDWRFWRGYLGRNSEVTVVAKEFQTGNKKPTEGRKAIDRMADLQDSIHRRLHPLVIGGAQFVEYVAERFDTFTLIDSRPFMNAVYRWHFDRNEGKPWRGGFKLIGQAIDDIMTKNITGYSSWIGERIDAKQR